MIRPIANRALTLIFLTASGAFTGCAQGPSEAEFVQACLHGPRQQGGEALCKCGASVARDTLNPKQYQAMILDMQGKGGEAERLLGDMSFDDRAQFAAKQFEILGKCWGDKEPSSQP